MIATVIAINGDDHGPVLTPVVAPIEGVVIPIPAKTPEDTEKVVQYAKEITSTLISSGIRAVLDSSNDRTPGEKYYVWELKGVPIRIEVGMRELSSGSVFLKRRDTLEGKTVKREDLVKEFKNLEDVLISDLRKRAWDVFRERVKRFENLDEVKKFLDNKGGIAEVPWCGSETCGLSIEEQVQGRVLGTPLKPESNGKCVVCGKPSANILRIAKTY